MNKELGTLYSLGEVDIRALGGPELCLHLGDSRGAGLPITKSCLAASHQGWVDG